MATKDQQLLRRAAYIVTGSAISLCLLIMSDRGRVRGHVDLQAFAASIEQGGSREKTSEGLSVQKSLSRNAAPQPTPAWISNPNQIRSWEMPKLDGVDKLDLEIVDLAVDKTGASVLAKSKREVYCFDLSAGRLLQTFRPPKSSFNRNPTTERMFLSPDARFVATWSAAPGKSKNAQDIVTFQEAQTARLVSSANVKRDMDITFDPITFSPGGETLLLPGGFRSNLCVQAVSVTDGTTKIIPLPAPRNQDRWLRILMPLPGQPAFVACWGNDRVRGKRPSRLTTLDLTSGTEQPLASIDIEPWYSFYDRRATVSPNGAWVLAQDERRGESDFEVGDLREGSVLFKHTESDVSFRRGMFTPDGKRFLVEWCPHFETVYFNAALNMPQKRTVPCRLQLYDVASRRKLAECDLDAYAQTLAISGDGRTIVYSHERELYAVDFRKAFRLDPLRPIARVEDSLLTER